MSVASERHQFFCFNGITPRQTIRLSPALPPGREGGSVRGTTAQQRLVANTQPSERTTGRAPTPLRRDGQPVRIRFFPIHCRARDSGCRNASMLTSSIRAPVITCTLPLCTSKNSAAKGRHIRLRTEASHMAQSPRQRPSRQRVPLAKIA